MAITGYCLYYSIMPGLLLLLGKSFTFKFFFYQNYFYATKDCFVPTKEFSTNFFKE